MLLLPFEPRHPFAQLFGFRLTLLEVAAGAATVGLGLLASTALARLVVKPTAPLLCLALFAATHALSALQAPSHGGEALRFSLRMGAMAAFAWTVAAAPARARRAGLVATALTAGLVALLAVAEGIGARQLDPFLNLFRESPFNVGGVRRATATTEYPNNAAAFLASGVAVATGLVLVRTRPAPFIVPATLLLSAGLLYTFSRGALLAAALGIATLWAALRRTDPAGARAPAIAFVVLAASTIAFSTGREVFQLRLGAENTSTWYRARYRPHENPLRLRPGEARTTPIELTNGGTKTWSVAEAFRLSYHLRDASGALLRFDGERTLLPSDLLPGQTVVVSAAVKAPLQEGRYDIDWDMVHEHTTWFSEQGAPVARVAALVSGAGQADPVAGAPRVREGSVEAPWRPGRRELWQLALEMAAQRPLLGVGSDNFRRLYGPLAGRAAWDSRVYANNTLLEAAATTGLLGLAALAALFVACGRAAWRRIRRAGSPDARAESAALLALLAATVAHGMSDYFLAFTGHYLGFGFLVGALGAPEDA